MKKLSLLLASFCVGAILFSTGCVSSGVLASMHSTQVQLNQANYKIVAHSVCGQAQTRYLLGFTLGTGMNNFVFALIPLQEERAIYRMAMENLWKNFEASYGKADGRTLALVNVRFDSEGTNLLVFTSPKVTVIADVVEFNK